ncbi:MAG: DUF6775 family putative metallopeptidase [Armatimonadota bacterium]
MDTIIAPVRHIYLYDDPDAQGLDIDYLAGYLASELPACEVGVRTDFITHHLGNMPAGERNTATARLSEELEDADPVSRISGDDLLFGEVLEQAEAHDYYLFRPLQNALRTLVPEREAGLDHLHIVVTAHLLAEIEKPLNFHPRLAALGAPSVISTSGLIEVPERPKEYHFRRLQYATFGADDHLPDLAEDFADRALGYGDPRLNDVLRGYMLMAVVYRATGDGPCDIPTCPLYAGDTQGEVLQAQVREQSRLCAHHSRLIQTISRQ